MLSAGHGSLGEPVHLESCRPRQGQARTPHILAQAYDQSQPTRSKLDITCSRRCCRCLRHVAAQGARAATLEKPSPRCWHNIPDFNFWGLNEAPPAAQIVIEPRRKAAAEQATAVPDLAPDLSPTPWPSTPSGDPRHGDRRGQGSINLPNLE